jgi:hypothetical protein
VGRNFALLFGARAISYFGPYLAPIAVAFAVLDLTGSATDTGIAFACWTVAQVSTLLVAGVVADRLPRRLVMVSSDLAARRRDRRCDRGDDRPRHGAARRRRTYAASALLLFGIRLPACARAAATPNFFAELRDGWRAWTEHTWVWLLNVWIAAYFLITYAPFFVLGPYIAKQSLGGAGAWGTVVAGEGIGALGGALGGLRVRPGRPWVVVGAIFALTSVQSILLAAHASFVLIAAAAVIAGFSFSLGSIIFETGVQRAIAPEKLSRVSAYSWMCAMVFLPLGYALAGPIAAAIGMSSYLVFGAVWILVTTAAVFAVPAVRNYRLPAAAMAAS